MTIAILATGDEIVHGDTLNTNSRDIAHVLSSEGLSLGLQLSCGDKVEEIISCLSFLVQQHDIIIIIGGLGPTTDDLTRFALSQFIKEPLVQHPDALLHIKSLLNKAKLAMNEGNLQQSLFPEQAQLLPNQYGSAMGCYYQWQEKHFFLLPGPPRECLPMFDHHVLPLLQQTTHSQKQILKWRIFGLAESEIAHTLEETLKDIDCQTGYRWEAPYIDFKVRCHPNVAPQIKSIIDPLIEPHVICSVNKKASEMLYELIVILNEPITIIDEVTGGLLQLLLTKPEVHHLLNFINLEKKGLYFHIQGLNEYWQQKKANGSTQLTIDYSSPNQEGHENHLIPYRSHLVVQYASEWLCFRLFHLVNQLHQ